MKLNKILLCTLAAGAMTFITNAAPAQPTILAKLNLSGSVIVNTNSAVDNGSKTTLKPFKTSFNVKDIVSLLNASPVFTNWLNCTTEGSISTLPPKTTFAYDIYGYYIYAVLPTGGVIRMEGFDCSDVYHYFLDMDFDEMSANYSFNDNTGTGSETDQLSEWWVELDDYNSPETDVYLQGQMVLKWSAGKVAAATRSLSVSSTFNNGSGDAEVMGYFGTGVGKASGSGKASSVSFSLWPFWNWWD